MSLVVGAPFLPRVVFPSRSQLSSCASSSTSCSLARCQCGAPPTSPPGEKAPAPESQHLLEAAELGWGWEYQAGVDQTLPGVFLSRPSFRNQLDVYLHQVLNQESLWEGKKRHAWSHSHQRQHQSDFLSVWRHFKQVILKFSYKRKILHLSWSVSIFSSFG